MVWKTLYMKHPRSLFWKRGRIKRWKNHCRICTEKSVGSFWWSVCQKSGLLDRVEKALEAEGIAYVELGGVTANPELKLVREGIALCQREGVDFVLGSRWRFCIGFFQRYCKRCG